MDKDEIVAIALKGRRNTGWGEVQQNPCGKRGKKKSRRAYGKTTYGIGLTVQHATESIGLTVRHTPDCQAKTLQYTPSPLRGLLQSICPTDRSYRPWKPLNNEHGLHWYNRWRIRVNPSNPRSKKSNYPSATKTKKNVKITPILLKHLKSSKITKNHPRATTNCSLSLYKVIFGCCPLVVRLMSAWCPL